MTRKGPRPRTGVVCLVKKARPKSMLCDTVYRFRANEAVITPEYLELVLNAPSIVQEINRRKSGINESGISLNHGRIKTIELPVPRDVKQQQRIVSAVNARMSLIDHATAQIDEQLGRTDSLRQAILKKAFSGQLVAQDPRDEPASVLLERIKAEREEQAATKKTTRGKKAA